MIHLSRTVAATWYLDQTNQWEAVNIDRRNEALQHIRTGGFSLRLKAQECRRRASKCHLSAHAGHLKQLTYRKTDGSFAAYPDLQSSTW